MDRDKLRLILEDVLETGIGDWGSHMRGWLNNKEYLEAKAQNIEGSSDLILYLISKLGSKDES